MSSRPTWFWTSFFSSIGVNAVLLTSSACWMYSQMKIYLPGYARSEVIVPIFIAAAPPAIPDTTLGDPTGKGDAADASEGDEMMQARQGPQAQAFLSRDPEGPGKVGLPPSMSTMIPGENGNGDDGAPAMFGAAASAQAMADDTPQFAPKQVATATPPKMDEPQQPRQSKTDQADEPDPSRSTAQDDSPQVDPTARADAKPTDAKPRDAQPTDVKPSDEKTRPDDKARPDETARAGDSTTTDDKKPLKEDSLEKQPVAATSPPPPPPPPPPSAVAYASITDAMLSPPSRPSAPSSPQSSGGGKPGPNVAPADPAPMSDSESDPFTKNGSVKFKRGATDVQFGRKHKIVRPQLGLAAQTDLLNLRDPVTLVLALTLDNTGKVIRVDVLKSSGSSNLDQACKVAAYQWWLEPTKDKSGKAVKDVVPFVIGFS